MLKESPETPKPITDQISDTIYTIECLINGSSDLDIDGVVDTEVEGDRSSEGAISALQGTPFEVIKLGSSLRIFTDRTHRVDGGKRNG